MDSFGRNSGQRHADSEKRKIVIHRVIHRRKIGVAVTFGNFEVTFTISYRGQKVRFMVTNGNYYL